MSGLPMKTKLPRYISILIIANIVTFILIYLQSKGVPTNGTCVRAVYGVLLLGFFIVILRDGLGYD